MSVCAVRVAAVSRDLDARLELARAFDAAPTAWRVTLHTEIPGGADVVVLGPDVDGDGIPFDPDDPDALIPAIEAALAREASNNVVVVIGTGGGVGTTTVALHLAMNAARSRSTCCIGGLDLSLRLDLPAEAPVWSGDGTDIDRAAIPVAGGFRAVVGTDLASAAEAARDLFDAVIVDGGSSDASVRGARAAILVCPPTVPGARRGSALVAKHPDVTWAVVTNRLGPGGEMTRVALEQILERRITLELPTCAPLRDAEDDGRLLDSVLYRWPRRVAQLWTALERA